MKKQFLNLNELYNCKGYFWKFGIYQENIKLIYGSKKPYLYNSNTKEIIKGLNNINRYLKVNEIEIEI